MKFVFFLMLLGCSLARADVSIDCGEGGTLEIKDSWFRKSSLDSSAWGRFEVANKMNFVSGSEVNSYGAYMAYLPNGAAYVENPRVPYEESFGAFAKDIPSSVLSVEYRLFVEKSLLEGGISGTVVFASVRTVNSKPPVERRWSYAYSCVKR